MNTLAAPRRRSSRSAREADQYQRSRESAGRRRRAQARAGQEIGPIPPIRDPERRIEATRSLLVALAEYFPRAFWLPWSQDHRKVIAKLERAIVAGGLFALAMPRGFGKTTIIERAAIWAILTGRRQFVTIIGATTELAERNLADIKSELLENELLAEDFPDILHPLRELEGNSKRCLGQRFLDQRTRIIWTARKLVLPWIAGSPAAGSVVYVAGITGALRGQKHKRPDGEILRPDLALIDDPQTAQSAHSITQTARRVELVTGDVLGMAGPKRKIAAAMPCTVIAENDLAAQLLNRKIHPDWQGEITKLVYSFPDNEELWTQYAEIRAEELRADGDGAKATGFYSKRRTPMDAGAIVAWPEQFDEDEISAIQHAMNLRLRSEAAFAAEYQNEPLRPADTDTASPEVIAGKTSGLARGELPEGAQWITAAIDVHDRVLYWIVTAWASDFSGWIIDYGSYPRQRKSYYTLREASLTLAKVHPKTGKHGAILAGLESLGRELVDRHYRRADGSIAAIDRVLVDAGYLPSVVRQAIRRIGRPGTIYPSMGVGIRAANRPFSQYTKKPGDVAGHHWRVPSVRGTRQLRAVHVDTNYWKTEAHTGLVTAAGDPAALLLFGDHRTDHRLLIDHLTAEWATRTEGHGRVVMEWAQKPGGPDNHFLDVLVYAFCAASILGARRIDQVADQKSRRGKRRTTITW